MKYKYANKEKEIKLCDDKFHLTHNYRHKEK